MSFRQEKILEVPEAQERSAIVTDLSAEEVFDLFYNGSEAISVEDFQGVVETFTNHSLKELLLGFATQSDSIICPARFGRLLKQVLK